MKTHSTNYFNTFTEIAEDCSAASGEVPPEKGDQKTVSNLQYDIVGKNPYKYTSDDVFFQVFAGRYELVLEEYKEAREKFFSKGQPCFRASPLTKRYGWGVHSNANGKVALYSCASEAYQRLSKDPAIKTLKAMKSKR